MSDSKVYEALGWMHAACCSMLEDGEDPRYASVPDLIAKAEQQLGLTASAEAAHKCHGTGVAVWSDAERWARRFHDAYERMAPLYGYTTRPETQEFDPASPNGKLMMAVVADVLSDFYDEHIAADKSTPRAE